MIKKAQSRRAFIRNGLVLAGSMYPLSKAGATQTLFGARQSEEFGTPGLNPDIHQILKAAIDASISAGASYADCRFTFTRKRIIDVSNTGITASSGDTESITVGIRSLINGYWGFASGTLWSKDEMIRLAKESVTLAARGRETGPREVVLAKRDVIQNENWVMPVELDPFDIHPNEMVDRIGGIRVFINNIASTDAARTQGVFERQNKHYMASDGCAFSQTTYLTQGTIQFTVKGEQQRQFPGSVSSISPAGVGFELFNEAQIRNEIIHSVEEIKKDIQLPIKPIEVGRYETLFGPQAVASILSGTIGAATEIDRVMGHEANATGTSYLRDPAKDLGKFNVGNSLLSVTANRIQKGGAATVKWDDEGVAPGTFPVVESGIVKDFQTSREGVEWVREGYSNASMPLVSRGCAYAPQAVDPILVHTANLTMQAGNDDSSEQSLMSNISNGIYFDTIFVDTDFQQLNTFATSPTRVCFEVKNGKKSAILIDGGTLFRTPEFWKSTQAIGGKDSARTFGISERKGQPAQQSQHSITAVPIVVKDLSVIDIRRKA